MGTFLIPGGNEQRPHFDVVILPAIAARMRVAVNSELCQGHNRCYALAPEVFDVDEYGNAIVLGDGEVPPDLEDKARLAISNCPEYAISIVEVRA